MQPDNPRGENKGISLGEQSSSAGLPERGHEPQIVQHSSVLCARLHIYKRGEIDTTISQASAPLYG
jgi:hypothetical protein